VVTLASVKLWLDRPWTASSIDSLRGRYADEVRLFEPTKWEWRAAKCVGTMARIPGISYSQKRFLEMRAKRWFNELIAETRPTVVYMNYAWWDWLLDHSRWASIRRVVEMHDLVTVNTKMRDKARAHFLAERIDPASVDDALLSEGFYDGIDTPDSSELSTYDRYDETVAICKPEAQIVQKGTQHTRVSVLPASCAVVETANACTGPAVFVASDNPFNLHGYVYFIRRVLPLVLQMVPDFKLMVAGGCCERVCPTIGVELLGYVEDLTSLYRNSSLAICPVFGGTGQQIKIVEAMAHGLPVVALQRPASRSPLKHEENGLVAENAEEFASHIVKLWRNRELRRSLGVAASTTLAKCSDTRTLNILSDVIDGPRE